MGASLAKQCFCGGDPHASPRMTRRKSREHSAHVAYLHERQQQQHHHRRGQRRKNPQARVAQDTRGYTKHHLNSDGSTDTSAPRHSLSASSTSQSDSGAISDDSFFEAMATPQEGSETEGECARPRVSSSHSSRATSPSAHLMRLLPSTYSLEEVIGKGTTSKCYRCRRSTDNAVFACKIIDKRRLSLDPHRRAQITHQLRREVDVLKRLNHPHIAKLEDSFENETHIILVMELLEGGELFDTIIDRGHLSELEAKHIAKGVLSAIQYMHEQGVVHRDIKPENLLLSALDNGALDVKIIDFGFSKLLPNDETTSSFLGTGGYLAPEILLQHPYTAAVDMWAFGVLLYLILCGRLPFVPSTQLQPHDRIASLYRLTFPEKYWKGVSTEAKDMVKRLLVLNPKHRLSADEAVRHGWLRA